MSMIEEGVEPAGLNCPAPETVAATAGKLLEEAGVAEGAESRNPWPGTAQIGSLS